MSIERLESRKLLSGTVYSAKMEAIPHLTTKEYIAQPLATFNHPSSMNTTGVTALINWGDGATEQYSTLENLRAVTDTQMEVKCGQGIHTYAKPGIYNVKVSFSENNKILTTARKAISVTQNSAGGRSVQLKTGTATPVVLGTFTSTTAPASSLVVSWGDGELGAAVVTSLKHNLYRVTSAHAYAKAGTYRVRVLDDLSNLSNAQAILLPSDRLDATATVRGSVMSIPTPTVTMTATGNFFHATSATTLTELATISGISPGFTRAPSATIKYGDSLYNGEVHVVGKQFVVMGILPTSMSEQIEDVTIALTTGDHIDSTQDTALATLATSVTIEPTTLGAIPVTAVAGTPFSGVIGTLTGTATRKPVSLGVSWGGNLAQITHYAGEPVPPGDPITITQTSDGQYQLSGSQTFQFSGRYSIEGTIHYSDGSTDYFRDIAIVVDSADQLPVGTGS